ncbi:PREDICTED: uncharacterized protein C10orf95-like, partial [Chinchilla lanigera]|uniref:uncharacterized protein C10orf95-like n=1 Tax=Chinchilla lanigera TaxID=34839 RepID=UPI0006976A2E
PRHGHLGRVRAQRDSRACTAAGARRPASPTRSPGAHACAPHCAHGTLRAPRVSQSPPRAQRPPRAGPAPSPVPAAAPGQVQSPQQLTAPSRRGRMAPRRGRVGREPRGDWTPQQRGAGGPRQWWPASRPRAQVHTQTWPVPARDAGGLCAVGPQTHMSPPVWTDVPACFVPEHP